MPLSVRKFEKQTSPPRTLFSIAHFCLALCAVALSFTTGCSAQENPNALALGKSAKTKASLNIALNAPVILNWKKKSDVISMRLREVQKYPQLLNGGYKPYGPIFDPIEDNKPWWGTAGAGAFDSGQRSIEGPSEESRFLMNPYLLVGANPGSTGMWNRARLTKKEIDDPNFPFFWAPESLKIDPSKNFGIVNYNITAYQQKIEATGLLRQQGIFVKRFSLVAYNARDFGFKYIYFNREKSINVQNENPSTDASFIRQMIHCGGTCGYPGGCNNMSPYMAEIDRLRITKLPARATVYLWKDEPESTDKTPDMVFLVEFR